MSEIVEIKPLCSLPEEIIRHIFLSGLSLQTLIDVIMTLNKYYYNLVANLLKVYIFKENDLVWVNFNSDKRMFKFYSYINRSLMRYNGNSFDLFKKIIDDSRQKNLKNSIIHCDLKMFICMINFIPNLTLEMYITKDFQFIISCAIVSVKYGSLKILDYILNLIKIKDEQQNIYENVRLYIFYLLVNYSIAYNKIEILKYLIDLHNSFKYNSIFCNRLICNDYNHFLILNITNDEFKINYEYNNFLELQPLTDLQKSEFIIYKFVNKNEFRPNLEITTFLLQSYIDLKNKNNYNNDSDKLLYNRNRFCMIKECINSTLYPNILYKCNMLLLIIKHSEINLDVKQLLDLIVFNVYSVNKTLLEITKIYDIICNSISDFNIDIDNIKLILNKLSFYKYQNYYKYFINKFKSKLLLNTYIEILEDNLYFTICNNKNKLHHQDNSVYFILAELKKFVSYNPLENEKYLQVFCDSINSIDSNCIDFMLENGFPITKYDNILSFTNVYVPFNLLSKLILQGANLAYNNYNILSWVINFTLINKKEKNILISLIKNKLTILDKVKIEASLANIANKPLKKKITKYFLRTEI